MKLSSQSFVNLTLRKNLIFMSDPPEQQKHENDHHDEAKTAGGVWSPVGRVSPVGQSADEEQDQYDEEDCTNHLALPEIQPIAKLTTKLATKNAAGM